MTVQVNAVASSDPQADYFSSKEGRKRLLGGAVGTFVEWFDFILYALTAPVFAMQFFDPDDPTAALLGTFAIFGVGFIARPIGGMLFGMLGDKIGRIRVLMITILLMGLATGVIGILPTFAAIGFAAPVLLLLARLLQGFSAGGEHSGALSFVIESAPHKRRGFWVGVIFSVSVLPGIFLGFGIIWLRQFLGEEVFAEWGWRIPFFVGAALAVLGLWMRMRLTDPEEFVVAKQVDKAENPLKRTIVEEWPALLRGIFLLAPHLVSYYLAISYLLTHMQNTLGMAAQDALLVNTVGSAFMVIVVPLLSRLGDKIGRKPLMWFGAIWVSVTAFPSMMLTDTATVPGALAGTLLILIGTCAYVGGGIPMMLEFFRTSSRQTGHGIAYNVCTVIFGGLTPFFATAIAAEFGHVAPAILPAIAGVIGIIVLVFTRETRDVNLTTAAIDLPDDIR